jgi:hypothetical protein
MDDAKVDIQNGVAGVRVLVAVAAISLLSGCATSPAVETPSPEASPSRFATARLAHAGDEVFVVADDGIYVETAGQLRQIGPKVESPLHDVFIAGPDSTHLIYAAVGDSNVVVFKSSDGGNSWSPAGMLPIGANQQVASVSVASSDARVVLLANEATSSAVSSATVARSNDGGGFAVSDAPVGGSISFVAGSYWLVGGVMGDQAFASLDGSQWRAVKLPALSQYLTLGLPVDVKGLGVVIPVTSNVPDAASVVTFLGTSDLGKTWHSLTSTEAPHTEFDTSVPASVTAEGGWVVVWPDGSKLVSGSLDRSDAVAISPNGLQSNVSDMAFVSPTEGFAVSSPDSCPSGKSSCISTTIVSRTTDGGQTWTPVE